MGCKMVISDINEIMWSLSKIVLPSFFQECTNGYWTMDGNLHVQTFAIVLGILCVP